MSVAVYMYDGDFSFVCGDMSLRWMKTSMEDNWTRRVHDYGLACTLTKQNYSRHHTGGGSQWVSLYSQDVPILDYHKDIADRFVRILQDLGVPEVD